jgi:glutathione S-transferase
MKIFGHSMSTCTRKVLTTLAEKQAKFELVTVDLATAGQKQPDFLVRQPFGQIPVLEDGDFRLYESRAIARYLDETLPGQALTPKEPKGRATMEQWISIETSNFTPYAMAYIYQYVFGPRRGQVPDAAKVADARPKLEKSLTVMDVQLARGPHLLGDQFTLADIFFMPYFAYAMETPAKELFDAKSNVTAWWKRVSERASWKAATGT